MKHKDFGVIVDGYYELNAIFHSHIAASIYVQNLQQVFGKSFLKIEIIPF